MEGAGSRKCLPSRIGQRLAPAVQLRKQLSLIAGVSFWRIYFRLFNGTIKGPQLVEFLKALAVTIRGKLLIIWDGLPAHRSRLVLDYVESLHPLPWNRAG